MRMIGSDDDLRVAAVSGILNEAQPMRGAREGFADGVEVSAQSGADSSPVIVEASSAGTGFASARLSSSS